MNQATVLQCHQSQSQSCVCGKSGVEVAMVAMPHTHHDACDEPPIPTTHSSVCVYADGGHGSGGCVGDGNGM